MATTPTITIIDYFRTEPGTDTYNHWTVTDMLNTIKTNPNCNFRTIYDTNSSTTIIIIWNGPITATIDELLNTLNKPPVH